MQIMIFNIPVTDTGEALSEMNRFLAGHKVLEVEQRFYQNDKGGYWSFCVRHIPGSFTGGDGRASGGKARSFMLTSDLSDALAAFNADKKTPLTLTSGITVSITPLGVTAEISDWEGSGNETVTAD